MAEIEEKHDYNGQRGSDSDHGHGHGVKDIVATKGAAVGEAADIYGDLATAEQYGYVERG
jgi:amino acid transporter